jgi:predicted kinase
VGPSAAQPLVVLTCGIAGSGKTTYAQRLEQDGFVRLSIDEEIWRRWGQSGVDYPASRHEELQRLAGQAVRAELVALVERGHDVVVDLSMSRRSTRDAYKALTEQAGGRWRLVYLRASEELLRNRLAARRTRTDANAFPVSDEVLDRYLHDFEDPQDEGEEVVEATT